MAELTYRIYSSKEEENECNYPCLQCHKEITGEHIHIKYSNDWIYGLCSEGCAIQNIKIHEEVEGYDE